jgi:hypothetical protein
MKTNDDEHRAGTDQSFIGRLLCRLGFHKFILIESIGSFGAGGSVQKLRCERCGRTTTRQQP